MMQQSIVDTFENKSVELSKEVEKQPIVGLKSMKAITDIDS